MSGYDGPTNDPWAAIRAKQQAQHDEAQEANRPGKTQTFQSVRKLWNAILELRTLVEEMVRLFRIMPWNDGGQDDAKGFNLPSLEWTKVATVVVPRPSDKNRANVSVVALASVLGKRNPLFNPILWGRIVVNGAAGENMRLTTTVQPGETTSNCAGTFGLAREVTGLRSPITVELWLRLDLMEELYPINSVASLSVTVGFTRVG